MIQFVETNNNNNNNNNNSKINNSNNNNSNNNNDNNNNNNNGNKNKMRNCTTPLKFATHISLTYSFGAVKLKIKLIIVSKHLFLLIKKLRNKDMA